MWDLRYEDEEFYIFFILKIVAPFLYYLSPVRWVFASIRRRRTQRKISWNLILAVDYSTQKMQGRDGPILDNSSCLFFFESSLPIHSLRCCIVGENMSKWAVSLKLSLNHREFFVPRYVHGERELLWFITNLLLTEYATKSSLVFFCYRILSRSKFIHTSLENSKNICGAVAYSERWTFPSSSSARIGEM